MSLELRNLVVNDIAFDHDNCYKDGKLTLCKKKLTDLIMSDDRIKSVDFDLALPGDSTRILPVKDVIEPRAKLIGEMFQGVFNEKMDVAGEGVTYAFSNCAVVTTGPIVGFQEGLIDMSGPGADYTIFSKIMNIVMMITKKDDVDPHEHEEVVRLAGLKLAAFIGKLGIDCDDYESVKYEWDNFSKKYTENSELPKVVYIYNCMSQGLLHDTYFYGKDSKNMVPTIISPLEVLDGAIVSGNCVSPGSKTTTYHHQNNAVMLELLAKHGKKINFVGIILNPLMVTLKEKYRNCMLTVRTVESLGADGALISQEGFGNPTTDLMQVCKMLETRGVKTVIITNEDAGTDGKSESLPDSVNEADAIITTGNSNEEIILPKMDKCLGDLEAITRVTGGHPTSIQEDGSLNVEVQIIMGSHNLQGNTYVSAVTL